MRQMRAVGSALSVVVLASACATTQGTRVRIRCRFADTCDASDRDDRDGDSALAQSIADREGPGATIRAAVRERLGFAPRSGTFRLDDDAYVLVGHIDADGSASRDLSGSIRRTMDSFVAESRIRHKKFFGGFADVVRPAAQDEPFQPASSRDSYDRGFGYMFIVASWRPMRFDQFATDGRWDTFELADADFMSDPRPAIHEFAAVVAGESREAYTVEFARYYNTQGLYSEMLGGSAYSSFGSASCSGFVNGFSSYPFADSPYLSNAYYGGMGYASSMWYRGQLFYADPITGCYRPSGFGFPGYGFTGYQIAQTPQTVTPVPRPRFFAPDGPRSPVNPRGRAPHEMPSQSTDGQTTVAANVPQVSPRYRERGLITADDPTPRTGRSDPRVDVRAAIEDHRRPAIQDMMTHRVETADNAGGGANAWSRIQQNSRGSGGSFGGSNGSDTRSRVRTDDRNAQSPPSSDNSRTYRAPSNDSPRREAPAPRSEPVRSEPVQRSEPARSAPVSAPASPPPASTGSASSSRPGTP